MKKSLLVLSVLFILGGCTLTEDPKSTLDPEQVAKLVSTINNGGWGSFTLEEDGSFVYGGETYTLTAIKDDERFISSHTASSTEHNVSWTINRGFQITSDKILALKWLRVDGPTEDTPENVQKHYTKYYAINNIDWEQSFQTADVVTTK